MSNRVYVVVKGANGFELARRFLEHDRVFEWLGATHGASCEVYDGLPDRGATRIARWERRGSPAVWELL